MSPEQKQLFEFAVQDLVAMVAIEHNLSSEAAMERVYHSRLFAQLQDPATGLYKESPAYLYAILSDEHSISGGGR